jgi:Thioredoxin
MVGLPSMLHSLPFMWMQSLEKIGGSLRKTDCLNRLMFRLWARVCPVVFASMLVQGCGEVSSDEVYATVDGREITRKEIDPRIGQVLYDQLSKIFVARRTLLDERVREVLLDQEAAKYGQARMAFLDSIIDSRATPEAFARFKLAMNIRGRIPDARSNLAYVDTGSVVGSEILHRGFRNHIKGSYLDSLLAASDVRILLEPPMRPLIDMQHVAYTNCGNTEAIVEMTILTDPECVSCRDFFPILDSIYLEAKNEVAFKLVPYSEYVSIGSMAMMAAGDQRKAWEMYRAISRSRVDIRDTASFERLAADIGLDVPRFSQEVRRPDMKLAIERNAWALQDEGIVKTPSLLINNMLIENFATGNDIRAEIEKVKSMVEGHGEELR